MKGEFFVHLDGSLDQRSECPADYTPAVWWELVRFDPRIEWLLIARSIDGKWETPFHLDEEPSELDLQVLCVSLTYDATLRIQRAIERAAS